MAMQAESLEELARRFDHFKMATVIERFPLQLETALGDSLPALPRGPFQRVVVVGMGGSALPVDVVTAAFAEQLLIPVLVVRHYELPASIGPHDLVIGSSFSGATEETLAAIEGLPPSAGNVVVITAGGRLQSLANARGYPLILIPRHLEPAGFQPRSAVGYFVSYLARVLSAAGAMQDVTESLAAIPAFLRSLEVRQDAEATARWLQDRIPVLYSDAQHQAAVARIAKIKFNENSKRPAFCNALPELNHNEMIGFTRKLGKFGILYFHDPESHPRIRERFEVMQRVFAAASLDHVAFREWVMPGKTRLERIFAALLFAERCSYDLALLDGLDPTPVAMLEHFKQALVSP